MKYFNLEKFVLHSSYQLKILVHSSNFKVSPYLRIEALRLNPHKQALFQDMLKAMQTSCLSLLCTWILNQKSRISI